MTACLYENAASPSVGNHPFWSLEGNYASGVRQIAYQPERCFMPLYDLRLMKPEKRPETWLRCDKGVMT